jgi:hypothetical protein
MALEQKNEEATPNFKVIEQQEIATFFAALKHEVLDAVRDTVREAIFEATLRQEICTGCRCQERLR